MKKALEAINLLKEQGLIKEYAIGGGIATIFYAEPFLTYDLDVFITLPEAKSEVIVLTPIYDYLRSRGYKTEKEHILIGDMPIQFIVAGDELEEAAVNKAIDVTYKDAATRVVQVEYLIALFLKVYRTKDISKISMLLEETKVDMDHLSAILKSSGLWSKWLEFKSRFT